jgi:hypothetical protein
MAQRCIDFSVHQHMGVSIEEFRPNHVTQKGPAGSFGAVALGS